MWLGSSGYEEESENLGAVYLERLQQLLFGLGIGCSSFGEVSTAFVLYGYLGRFYWFKTALTS
jgi:hypothetical protein